MENVLSMNLKDKLFTLDDYDDEDGFFIPTNDEVASFKESLINCFDTYKSKLKEEMQNNDNLTRIVKLDVILFYIYDMYTNALEESVVSEVIIDEEEIVKLWIKHYLQAFECDYPKILKITY